MAWRKFSSTEEKKNKYYITIGSVEDECTLQFTHFRQTVEPWIKSQVTACKIHGK